MNNRKRSAVRITAHATRYRMSEWLKRNKNVPFDVPYLKTIGRALNLLGKENLKE